MKIGLIREGKVPPDARVPLTPGQCREVCLRLGHELVVQPSPVRCFPDAEYKAAGIPLQEDLSDCDILLGVKEVPVDALLEGKTYLFFSHTIKRQPYNRALLRAVIQQGITLVDYEVIRDATGSRLIAFGHFAGLVGAYNAIWAYGERTGLFRLARLKTFRSFAAALEVSGKTGFPPVKVVLTGTGRVANGAAACLADLGFRRLPASVFLDEAASGPVFCQLSSSDYIRRNDGRPFERAAYHRDPSGHRADFLPFCKAADIFIQGIFWDKRAPVLFTAEDMMADDFRIQVVGDITCDIAPDASIPCTIRPSTIDAPVYGYDPRTGKECEPFRPEGVDVMAIDNLPSEVPRDASEAFGRQLMEHVLPELERLGGNPALNGATIVKAGQLTPAFAYLEGYVKGTE
jgi:alanine dehydrogenase